MHNIHIHWFRQDLRLADNPALSAAARQGVVLPIFILDDDSAGWYKAGAATRWWLHNSLGSLNASLGGKLCVYVGNAEDVLLKLVDRFNVIAVHWNRCYEPWRIKRDSRIKEALKERNIEGHSYNGSLLWEPWEIAKGDGAPYRVFTPYFQKCRARTSQLRQPLSAPKSPELFADEEVSSGIHDLNLLPAIRWNKQLEPHWRIGEAAAYDGLHEFIENGLDDYKVGRDFPGQVNVSRLSPHIHFGEISPNQIWHSIAAAREEGVNEEHFFKELGWREFSYSLLYHNPDLPHKNLQSKFDTFPWRKDKSALHCWQKGLTGYPIIDAGMRELWQTGYMHNRVRMLVGSFLVKNLMLDWREGERWFWDCLVDADLANNSASWQWIAGCGADAAPYFRIFNPVTQGQKFDPDGAYTRQFVPELSALPNKFLFNPWEAKSDVLHAANVKLGETYPHPIVDLKLSRERALEAFKAL